jgi:glycoprotein endo-alpha-1,2-mannosidase
LAAHLLSLIPADAWSYGHLGNFHNTKSRSNGQYYDQHWQTAIDTKPTYISITSYNEWMEGTQIEAVQPKKLDKTIYDGQPYTYQDYGALAENFYMDKTNQWTARFLGHEN